MLRTSLTTPRRRARLLGAICLAAAAVSADACTDPVIPQYNAPTIESVGDRPSADQVQALVTGLALGLRADFGTYQFITNALGRDIGLFDPEARFVTQTLNATIDPAGFIGSNLYANHYRNIRAANVLLPKIAGAPYTEEEQAGLRGVVRTIKAVDYYYLIEVRDTTGIPLRVEGDPAGPPAPIVCKRDVLAYTLALLDSAKADLAAAGAAIPVRLPSGFAAFTTPAAFLQFNRAIRARASLMLAYPNEDGIPSAAGVAELRRSLDEAFGDTTKALTLGVYAPFSTAAGDAINPIFNTSVSTLSRARYLPNFLDDLEPGDTRVAAKVARGRTVPNAAQFAGVVGSDAVPTVYKTSTDPIPVIRNEELIYLRAQQFLAEGNLAEAARLINFFRVRAGLAPKTLTSPTQVRDELLRQKRIGLAQEGAQRLVDLRNYGLIQTQVRYPAGAPALSNLPLPAAESLARGGDLRKSCSA
ncbi:MAG: hypothetical protein WKG32_17885 [Gemmatimonadaceae bacterium]